MATSPAQLDQIRIQAGRALEDFLSRQRDALRAIGPDMLPWIDAIGELLAGGKRLRPAFCYWGWRAAGGGDCPQIHTAAAALELLHASALVHDDVMDSSDTRRGRASVHRRFAALHQAGRWRGSADSFGVGAAILIGDLLLGWTDELFAGSGLPPQALRRGQPVLDAMRAEVICGQYLDLLGQSAGEGTVASALRVAAYKSAKYTIERPLQLGVTLAGQQEAGPAGPAPGGAARTQPASGAPARAPAPEQVLLAACTGYGMPLGVAFQLRDDLLGVFGDPALTGKPASDDLREGKQTVLVAIARERASAAQRELLDRHLGDRLLDEAATAEIRALLTGTGAVAECERMIDSAVADALSALTDAPMTDEAKRALADLAVAATARSG